MYYTAYGLIIESQLSLPELNVSHHTAAADVTIRLGAVEANGLPGGSQLGPYLWVAPGALWLQVPGVARFLVQNGNAISCDPEFGVDEDSIRVFLLGSAFGALLFQRGHLVLHGNAIRIEDQCLVCVGPSGAGKSTLAAGFMQRGYTVLADDVVAVDVNCDVLPGYPRIKLWQDATDKLKIDLQPLRRIRPGIEKFNVPVPTKIDATPLPIRWVYILSSEHIESAEIHPIHGMQRFQPLRNNTYRVRFLEGSPLKSEHLKLCGRLAGRVRLAHIKRPKFGFNLDQMIDIILADVGENP